MRKSYRNPPERTIHHYDVQQLSTRPGSFSSSRLAIRAFHTNPTGFTFGVDFCQQEPGP